MDLGELARLKRSLESVDRGYGAIRNDLGGASRVMAAGWTGESQLAYRASHGDWSAATSALAELQGGLQQSGLNHARAEESSAGKSGEPSRFDAALSEVCSFGVPPSAAGGCVPEPEGWDLVAAAVGHAWPDGDPDKLRLAGSAWGNLAEGIEEVHASHFAKATTPLASFRSPEIPLIDAKVGQVGGSLQSSRRVRGRCRTIP